MQYSTLHTAMMLCATLLGPQSTHSSLFNWIESTSGPTTSFACRWYRLRCISHQNGVLATAKECLMWLVATNAACCFLNCVSRV